MMGFPPQPKWQIVFKKSKADNPTTLVTHRLLAMFKIEGS